MTEAQLQEIERRMVYLTAGEWEQTYGVLGGIYLESSTESFAKFDRVEDAQFCADAPKIVRKLIAEIRKRIAEAGT